MNHFNFKEMMKFTVKKNRNSSQKRTIISSKSIINEKMGSIITANIYNNTRIKKSVYNEKVRDINKHVVKTKDIKLKNMYREKLKQIKNECYKTYYDKLNKIKEEFHKIPADVILYKILIYHPYNCKSNKIYRKQTDLFGYFKWDNARKIYLIFKSIIGHQYNDLYININELYSYNGTHLTSFQFLKLQKYNILTQLELSHNLLYKNVNSLLSLFKSKSDNNDIIIDGIETFNKLIKIYIDPRIDIKISNCKFTELKSIEYTKIDLEFLYPTLCYNYMPKIEEIKLCSTIWNSSNRRRHPNLPHMYELSESPHIRNLNTSILYSDNFLNLKYLHVTNIQDENIFIILCQYEFPKLQLLQLKSTKLRDVILLLLEFNEFPELIHIDLNFKRVNHSIYIYKKLLAKQTYEKLKNFMIGFQVSSIYNMEKDIECMIPSGVRYLNIKIYSENRQRINKRNGDSMSLPEITDELNKKEKIIKQTFDIEKVRIKFCKN